MTQRIWPDRQIDLTIIWTLTIPRAGSGELPSMISRRGCRSVAEYRCRMTDIVGHPSDAQHFYVAAASGGIFKTTNGGTDWIPIFDDAPGMSMEALAIDLVSS